MSTLESHPDIRLPVADLGYHPTGKRDVGEPVSYTHLDVYKRQVRRRERICLCERNNSFGGAALVGGFFREMSENFLHSQINYGAPIGSG